MHRNWKKAFESMKRLLCASLAFAMIGVQAHADETATLSVKSIPDVNIRMYGFVENDLINDSKDISALEELDNPLVPKANTWAGQNGKTLMSIRNSRLGFDVTMPKTDAGLMTEGIFEFDLLGNNAESESIGATATSAETERDLYNNAAVRIRHAYVNLTDGQWNGKIGQTWSLLGWQPHYFPAEPNVAPTVGMLYRRFPQIRATNTQDLMGGSWTLETAVDAAKPAEMLSQNLEYHGGIRLASTQYKAGVWAGSGNNVEGLSLAASGAIVPIRTGDGSPTGSAVALDAFVPIIPSKDGKDPSNTLSLLGEYCNGTGIGGLELAGLTGGVGAVTNLVQANKLNTQTAIDSGIAGISTLGYVELLHVQTFRASLQYILPYPKWSVNGGYADDEVFNLQDFGAPGSATELATSPHDQYYFGDVQYAPLSWLKFGLELAQIKTTYNDPNNTHAYDNRAQFTTYFVF